MPSRQYKSKLMPSAFLLVLLLDTQAAHAASEAPSARESLFGQEALERAGGAWSSAIDDIDQILQREPENIKALLDRATCEKAFGCERDARENAGEVLALEPGNTAAVQLKLSPPASTEAGPIAMPVPTADDEAWQNYGPRELCIERNANAVEGFSQALARERKRADALNDRAVALTALHRYSDALQDLNAASAKRPGYPAAVANPRRFLPRYG